MKKGPVLGSCFDMNMVSSRFRSARYNGRVGRITRDRHLEECLLFKDADHPDMRIVIFDFSPCFKRFSLLLFLPPPSDFLSLSLNLTCFHSLSTLSLLSTLPILEVARKPIGHTVHDWQRLRRNNTACERRIQVSRDIGIGISFIFIFSTYREECIVANLSNNNLYEINLEYKATIHRTKLLNQTLEAN